MKKIKTSKKSITASFVLLVLVLPAISFSASAAQEEKTLKVGDTWEKDGWNLTVKAVEITAQPRIILISLSYLEKNIGDSKIENGKTYTYMGRNPDGSETSLFTIKVASIFVGTDVNLAKLAFDWSIPADDVQIIGVPVESDPKETQTPVPTPIVRTSPDAPGFGMILGIIGVLAVCWRLKK